MAQAKFSDEQLKQLVKDGLGVSEIAKRVKASKSAVSQRLKTLNIAITKSIALRRADKIIKNEINAVEQLQKINDNANELLDLLMRWNRGDEDAIQILESQVRLVRVNGQEEPVKEFKFKDPRELALKAMQEIRGQLKLQLEIFQALYDIKAVAEFQREVLEAIASVSPETRDRIIRTLQERRAILNTLELH